MTRYKYYPCLTLIAVMMLLLLVSAALAEEKDNATSPDPPEACRTSAHRLETITVTDEALPQREDLDPDSLVNPYRIEATNRFATEVFTQKEIQDLQPSGFYDLLDKGIGINLSYQGRKHPFFISQRGGGSFTYIIDGAVLPPSTDRILYKFPVAAIEELKIVRGATALTLGPAIPIGASNSGSGLNTGFIIIRTRQPDRTRAALAAAVEQSEGGHPLAYNASVYAGTRFGDTAAANGYIGALAAKADRPSQESWFDGRDSQTTMANTGFKAGKFYLNVMAYQDRGSFEMQRGVAEDGTLSDVKWYYDPLKTSVLSGDMTLQWSPNQVTLLNLFQVKYEQTEHNDSFISPVTVTKEYEEETSGVGLRHNARFFENTIVQLGGQVSNSTGFGPNLSRGYNKYDTTVTGWSASIEQRLLGGDLVFDGGYRQDHKHIDNSSAGKNEDAANDAANNDVDLAPTNVFALGAHWRPNRLLVLDGRYYYGKQGTTGDFDMRAETGELHPEKQNRIELAMSADIKPWFRPAVTWFNIEAENAKSASSNTYELDGATYYYYTEADELRRGVEVMIQGRILSNTTYRLSWTCMLDNETTSHGETTDTNGIKNPENLYALTLGHRWRAYRANLAIKQVDAWVDSSSPIGTVRTDGLGGYTRIDANIKREFELNKLLLTITLYGHNLLDENYSTRYVTGFYPDRGRTYGMEVCLAF